MQANTLQNHAERYIREVLAAKSYYPKYLFRCAVRCVLLIAGEDVTPADLNPETFAAALRRRRQSGATPGTLEGYALTLLRFWRYLHAAGLMDCAPPDWLDLRDELGVTQYSRARQKAKYKPKPRRPGRRALVNSLPQMPPVVPSYRTERRYIEARAPVMPTFATVTADDVALSATAIADRTEHRRHAARTQHGGNLDAWMLLYADAEPVSASTRKGWRRAIAWFTTFLNRPGTLDDLTRLGEFSDWCASTGRSASTCRLCIAKLKALRRFAGMRGAVLMPVKGGPTP